MNLTLKCLEQKMKKLLFRMTILLSASSLTFAEDKQLQGVVLTSDGQPAAGARITVIETNKYVGFESGNFCESHQREADSQGHFSFSVPPKVTVDKEPAIIFIKGSEGVCLPVSKVSQKVILPKAVSVHGTFARYGKAVQEGEVLVTVALTNPSATGGAVYEKRVKTDKAGVFETGDIPAGQVWLSPVNPESKQSSIECRFSLPPGEKASVDLGGNGVDVVGKLKIEDERTSHLKAVSSNIRVQLRELDSQGEEKQRTVTVQREYPVIVSKDGSFKAENIPPGKYQLLGFIVDAPTFFAYRIKEFMVADTTKQPLNIGDVELEVFPKLQIGWEAPDFAFQTLDGGEERLSIFKANGCS